VSQSLANSNTVGLHPNISGACKYVGIYLCCVVLRQKRPCDQQIPQLRSTSKCLREVTALKVIMNHERLYDNSGEIYIKCGRLNYVASTSTFIVLYWILVQVECKILSHLEIETSSITAKYIWLNLVLSCNTLLWFVSINWVTKLCSC
jgi:hypothetical protein